MGLYEVTSIREYVALESRSSEPRSEKINLALAIFQECDSHGVYALENVIASANWFC